MPKFIEALTATDFENLFKHMHASIALIDKHGNVLTANQNFETHKEFIQNKLPKKLTEMHWVEKLPLTDTEQSHLDCFLIPASDERFILLADPVNFDPASKTQIESLQKQVKMFQIESEVSKKIARNKQIELDAVVEQAKEVAEIDALTYIYNRRAIIRELQSEVLRAERYQSALSISIIDVDHFKKINDTYGHMVGDGVLKEVAILLRDGIRSPDVVGRYGGEEFLILLPNSNLHAAEEQAARLCTQMREKILSIKGQEINVTFSIGTTQFKLGEDTWDTLLKRADNAMYEAKHKGRDCWVSLVSVFSE